MILLNASGFLFIVANLRRSSWMRLLTVRRLARSSRFSLRKVRMARKMATRVSIEYVSIMTEATPMNLSSYSSRPFAVIRSSPSNFRPPPFRWTVTKRVFLFVVKRWGTPSHGSWCMIPRLNSHVVISMRPTWSEVTIG